MLPTIRRAASLLSPGRALLVVLAALAVLVSAVGCESSRATPRPSPSLIILQFTPRPSRSLTPSPSALPSVTADWPIGWDVEFCRMFTDAVIAQQLVVDVERALDEDNTRDARLLADELSAVAAHTSELLLALTPWPDAETTSVGIAALMDLGGRAAAEYQTFFAKDRRPALRRARALRQENGAGVPDVNEELAALADMGLTCPGNPLELEAPA
ncbi:MAG: hypothetical protein ABI797_03600 [Chloroflexota bacterium]